MGGMASDGAYGEFDPDTGKNYGDFSGGFDEDPVDMFASGELDRDQLDSYQNVLNSMENSSDPEMDDDLIDFSNPTRDGAEPLKSNFSDFLNNLDFDKLKDLPGGKGSGPQPLGSSGSLKGASAEGVTGARGFRQMESPYAAPKYYTPQGSVEFQKMVSGLLSNVFGSSIRKPSIRSLI